MTDAKTRNPDIADYDDEYDYRRDFWSGHGRDYEDLSERRIIKKLLPAGGRYAIDIGGGFGRLLPLYAERFEVCVVFDFSMKNLEQARAFAEEEEITNLLLVAGDAARMPFSDGFFDFAISVRLSHHFREPGDIISEASRVLTDGGYFIFEFANKRNFKSVLTWMMGKQKDNPFKISPKLIGEKIRNFHPKHIYNVLRTNNFVNIMSLSASNFRLSILKRAFGSRFLSKVDLLFSRVLGLVYFGPSIFTRSFLHEEKHSFPQKDGCFLNSLFKCPTCRGTLMLSVDYPGDGEFNILKTDLLLSSFKCGNCGFSISEKDGIFDFR